MDGAPESPLALAATDRPLPLRLEPIEDERAPAGLACIGSFLGSRLVARCVVPPEAAALLLERGLFEHPVRLALAAREGGPGLKCQLFALLDLPSDLLTEVEDDGEPEAPWAGSVPGASYEREIQGGADPESPEAGAADSEPQAAVFLGEIVRLQRDRRHPEDLGLEAVDVLRTIVAGEVSEVVDKVLEDLLGGAGPAS